MELRSPLVSMSTPTLPAPSSGLPERERGASSLGAVGLPGVGVGVPVPALLSSAAITAEREPESQMEAVEATDALVADPWSSAPATMGNECPSATSGPDMSSSPPRRSSLNACARRRTTAAPCATPACATQRSASSSVLPASDSCGEALGVAALNCAGGSTRDSVDAGPDASPAADPASLASRPSTTSASVTVAMVTTASRGRGMRSPNSSRSWWSTLSEEPELEQELADLLLGCRCFVSGVPVPGAASPAEDETEEAAVDAASSSSWPGGGDEGRGSGF
mmetsp:Transcript_9499/g.29944  ORF Transcript_9499/g.29944 Transcript_9499/m.29944 type:complete len:280 (-) Transcript_9499:886-1725(-)